MGVVFFSDSLETFLAGAVVDLLADEMVLRTLRSLVSPLSSECLLVPAVKVRFTTSPSSTALPCGVAATGLAPTEVLVTIADLGPVLTPTPPPPAVTPSTWETTFDLRGLVEGEEVDDGDEGVELALALMLLLLVVLVITLLLFVFLSTPIMERVAHTLPPSTLTHEVAVVTTCTVSINLQRSTG